MKTSAVTLLFCALALCPRPAAAMNVAAIVEAVSGAAGGIGEMDLLEEGRVIELGSGARLTLGYPESCMRETISGGRVTIGATHSSVSRGALKAEKVDCDAGRILAPGAQAGDVAGAVFRREKFGPPPEPDRLIHGVSPVIRFSQAVLTLTIERLDKPEETIRLPVGMDRVDLAARNVTLAPSGLYAFSAGSRPVIVQVSPDARPGAPLLSRLVVM